MTETQPRLCQTGDCTWIRDKDAATTETWLKLCPLLGEDIVARYADLDLLRPTECPPNVAYALCGEANTDELEGEIK